MNKPALLDLRLQVERTIGKSLSWTTDDFFGGSAWAELPNGEIVSVMVSPPDGEPHVKMPPGVFGDNGDDIAQPDAPDDFDQDEPLPSLDVLGGGKVDVDALGATVTGDLSLKEWNSAVGGLMRFGKALPWIVGDLLNYGEAKWGEQYAQVYTVAQTLHLSPNTLNQYKSVAGRVPRSERVEDVSWSCWRMLAARTPEERQTGVEAYIEGRTTEEVKRELDGKPEPVEDELPPCPVCGAPNVLKTKCPSCGRTFLDVVWWALGLVGEVRGFAQTGEIGQTLKGILEANND